VAHEIFPSAGQRPERLGRVAIRNQYAVAVAVGASELGEHERVEAVALAARGAVPRAHRCDLVRMHRDHPQTRIEQPLDQQPIGALHRDELRPELQRSPAQRSDPGLVMPIATALHDPPVRVDNAARVFLAGPINASRTTLYHDLPSTDDLDCCRRRGTSRLLTDRALIAQLPVAYRSS